MNISWPWNSAFTSVRFHGVAECTDLYICTSVSRTETCFKRDETFQIFKSLQLYQGNGAQMLINLYLPMEKQCYYTPPPTVFTFIKSCANDTRQLQSKLNQYDAHQAGLLLIQYSAVWLLEMADYTGLSILCTSPFKKMFAWHCNAECKEN